MIRKRLEPGRDGRDVLVVFDLDGTLTGRDTSLPFVAHAVGAWRLGWVFVTRSPLFVWDLLRVALREVVGPQRRGAVWGLWEVEVHRRVLDGALRGATREELVRHGSAFALDGLDDFVTPEAVAHLEWHQARGHRCVLASASLDVYVEPWAKRMGFDTVVATRLAFDDQDRFIGRFVGRACFGVEKLRRVRRVVSSLEDSTVVVYGDSKGDAALMAAADLPCLIPRASDWPDVAAAVCRALEG